MEVYTEEIDTVDAWDVFYEVGTDDFRVFDKSTSIWWEPVFYYDKDDYPSDFEGWNPSK